MKRILSILVILVFITPYYSISQTGWYKVYSGSLADVNTYTDMTFVNQTTGFVCGGWQSGGYVLITTDGGLNWTPSLFAPQALLNITFTNELTGYTIGAEFTSTGTKLYKTIDGGLTWTQYTTNDGYSYYDSYFFNSNTGFIVGDQGRIMKTVNGGMNWSLCTVYYTDFLYAVDFINQNTGFAAGENGKIFITTDGGGFWDPIFISGSDIRSLKFFNQTTGYAVGNAGKLFKTTNSGINWQTNILAAGMDFTNIYLLSQNNMYIASENGVVLKTTNGGLNWNQQVVSTNSSLKNVYFLDEQFGFACGSKSSIFRTQTGGELLPLTTLISPANNAFNLSLTPTLVWTALSDIINYTVQVSTTQSFDVIADSATINTNQRTVPAGKLLSNTYYFWRVKATNNLGTGPWTTPWRLRTGNVGITNISNEIPDKFSIGQNYPNPFNPMCNVQFSICNAGNVKLMVYDVQGREVQTLVNERLQPGTYEAKFDGSMLNSGVYFYKLVTDGFTETKKMLMIK